MEWVVPAVGTRLAKHRRRTMGFGMFSAHISPIAIDFGSSLVKMLQIEPGEPPTLAAALGFRMPQETRLDKDRQLAFLQTQLPRMLRKGKFRGKRVVCSVPSAETIVQHMQISPMDGVERDDLIKSQLQTQLGRSAHGMVIRSFDVTKIRRDGETLLEVICVAMNRETVMRYVELLGKCKLDVVGVHSEMNAMVQAFEYLTAQRGGADRTTLYVDIGWGSTKVAISHGGDLGFARCIQLGGRHLDERLAEQLGCDVASAQAQRISEQVLAAAVPSQSPQTQSSAATSTGVISEDSAGGAGGAADSALSEVTDALADELSMCLRYHQSLFRNRKIDRMVFLGGEARETALCQRVARALRLPAQLGDPLARLQCRRSLRTSGLALGQPQPGWAVACGLCTLPTDL